MGKKDQVINQGNYTSLVRRGNKFTLHRDNYEPISKRFLISDIASIQMQGGNQHPTKNFYVDGDFVYLNINTREIGEPSNYLFKLSSKNLKKINEFPLPSSGYFEGFIRILDSNGKSPPAICFGDIDFYLKKMGESSFDDLRSYTMAKGFREFDKKGEIFLLEREIDPCYDKVSLAYLKEKGGAELKMFGDAITSGNKLEVLTTIDGEVREITKVIPERFIIQSNHLEEQD